MRFWKLKFNFNTHYRYKKNIPLQFIFLWLIKSLSKRQIRTGWRARRAYLVHCIDLTLTSNTHDPINEFVLKILQIFRACALTLKDLMDWIYLLIAGLCEIGFTTFLKLSDNFTRLWPTLMFIFLAACSFISLSMSLKSIPIGTSYAVWTGIGAFGTAVVGIIYYGEATDFWRLFFLAMLISSILGLKFVSPH